MKVNHEERFEWSEPDQFDYTSPPLREGDEMANPLDESDELREELDDLESDLDELGESEPTEEEPSVGDAGSVTQR